MDTNRDQIVFEWDSANSEKNWFKHHVHWTECEQIFLNDPLIVVSDALHSIKEKRFQTLGQTHSGRKLFIAFTIRKNVIRIISARDMSQKERRQYEAAP